MLQIWADLLAEQAVFFACDFGLKLSKSEGKNSMLFGKKIKNSNASDVYKVLFFII